MTKAAHPIKTPEAIDTIEISYYTPDFPPPYSYSYLLKIKLLERGLEIDFDMKYTDRDEIEEDDILSEGFTLNDDFAFKGLLPQNWKESLESKLKHASWLNDNRKNVPLFFKIFHADLNKPLEVFPSDFGSWDYFLQELVQGIFEAGKKERPLEVIYKEIAGKGITETLVLKGSFLERRVFIHRTGKTSQEKEVSWKALKKIMKAVFLPDYHPELAEEKEPKKVGKYLNPGDGLWYQLGKAITNPNPEINSVELLEKELKNA